MGLHENGFFSSISTRGSTSDAQGLRETVHRRQEAAFSSSQVCPVCLNGHESSHCCFPSKTSQIHLWLSIISQCACHKYVTRTLITQLSPRNNIENKNIQVACSPVFTFNLFYTKETSCLVLWRIRKRKAFFCPSMCLIITFKCWHLCMNRRNFSKDNVTEFIFFLWPLNDFLVLPHLSIFWVCHSLSCLKSLS